MSPNFLTALLQFVIVITSLLILLFAVGKFYVYKHIENLHFVSIYSVWIGFAFFFHLLSILAFLICTTIAKGFQPQLSVMLLYLPLPFLIGKFSRYEQIDYYTNLQILSLIAFVVTCILILKNSI